MTFPSLNVETCARKRRYASWDDARRAGLLATRENPRPCDVNPSTPYPCDVLGESHYHYGHLRIGQRVVVSELFDRLTRPVASQVGYREG